MVGVFLIADELRLFCRGANRRRIEAKLFTFSQSALDQIIEILHIVFLRTQLNVPLSVTGEDLFQNSGKLHSNLQLLVVTPNGILAVKC